MFLLYVIQRFSEWLRLVERSDQLLFLFLVLVCCVLAAWIALSDRHHPPIPPGPRGLPVLGYLPFMGSKPLHKLLDGLAKRYGPVFSIQLGMRTAVVLADHAAIREALRKGLFSGRPLLPFTDFLNGYGIVNSDGELWKEQRRFTHEILRDFGTSMNNRKCKRLEQVIESEVESLMTVLAAENGNALDPQPLLATCVGNVISSLLMSTRFEQGDPRFARLLQLVDEGFRLFSVVAPVNFVGALRHVPGVQKACNHLKRNRQEMFAFFRDVIEQHKATLDPEKPRDLVDAYLVEMKRVERDEGRTKYSNEPQLYQILADMFTSGLESTRVAIQWLLLYMATHPEMQRRVQEEIDGCVGNEWVSTITLDQLSSLPYTEATVMETLRISNVLAVAPAHSTLRDTVFKGFTIPKDTIVLPLLYAVHMDPTVWKNPEEFCPERFLLKDGSLHRPDCFMPFGTGRRSCLGSILARLEIQSIFTTIMRRFTVSLPEGADVPSFVPIATTTLSPPPFKICTVARQPEMHCC